MSSPMRLSFLAAAFAAPLVVSASGAGAAEPTRYPLTLQTCGQTITFDRAPSRVVSIGQSSTEILYLLGLADKVVGTALWVGPVIAGYEAVDAKVPRLADNDPSFESVVGKKPDLVTNQYQWQVGPKGVVATNAQFAELKIPVYTSPADCVGKDNSEGGDGLRTSRFTTDLIYQEIEDLARIFDVSERGEVLINDLKAREAAAKKKIASLRSPVSAVFWFSSADLDIDPYVAGSDGAPGYILSVLGITNVIKSEEEWPTVGWETIAKANPTIIVAGEMTRRRFPVDDIAVKKTFLANDPVTRLMPAVQEGRIVPLDAQAMNPTIRTIEGIEVVADAVIKAGLAQ
ncbi:Periplasmic binding protein [Rhodospirillum rubrum ATCC 11170]|uniref:Periplasmic binding protein n=2 Tax=Rhodospirillum rubrum TaxID=1085 RepID=Q2RVA8_RHORT|nr:ABC transporter substrate-binding protein [Rhodospirillum rubrum]ABC21937.1 Periplasmic binding protein [Rhodospirillum rubrum ATCC 11170]MBK5953503.1 ABC transporter substrate-binding protein [Rhodospirillum rubrum]HAP99510.1 ABC transporter substrate-binding protein [Rhodospirillum rubrum]HCF17676.1 ABC transporter substrate-binding protein [Rhodospirillum rubrum]